MATILTYVSSYTYDELLGIMYPDETAKERTLEEIERLIVQGHSIEHRFGDNMTTLLDLDKFNTYVKPKYQEEKVVDTSVNDLQHQLNNLFPDVSLTQVIEEPVTELKNDVIEVPEVILQPINVTPSMNSVEVQEVRSKEEEVKNELIESNEEEIKEEEEVVILPKEVVELSKSTKKSKK